jgi:hypothetical protein
MTVYSDAEIRRNTITGNVTPGAGGAGLTCWYGTSIIENNVISGNTATGRGGGVFLLLENSTISNNLFTENAADTDGGGIRVSYSSATLSNNTITENTTQGSVGGVWVTDSSSVNITNTISWNNTATTGEEIAIVYNNSSIPSTLTISYSDVEGGEEGVFVDSGCTLNWSDGINDADPLFMTYKGLDYFLDALSPCIDTGDPLINDAISDWHPRCPDWLPNGPESDMGAYGGPGNKGWVK